MQPPFELFLAAAIVVACAAIPLFWVRKDSDRLRSELMSRKAAAEEDAAAEEQLPSESTAD